MSAAIDAWLPKSVLLLREYNCEKFTADWIAGVTVGLVALPLAMAFAIASGVSPQAGIYCAIGTGFLISALGGSKTQIGGPTGAFVVVVLGIISKYGLDGLFTCTMLAGLILVIMGATGLGGMVKYFPRPVVVGFTNGIAILIASTQIRDLFGLRMEHVPGDFFHRMGAIAENFHTLNWTATVVGFTSLAGMIIFARVFKRIAGNGRDCANGDECAGRRENSGGRDDSRADAAGGDFICSAACEERAVGGFGGNSVHGRLQHGRLGRNSRNFEAECGGHYRVA